MCIRDSLGPDGSLYAATLPSGKVFRLKPDATTTQDEASAQLVFDSAKLPEVKTTDSKSDTKPVTPKPDEPKSDSASRLSLIHIFDQAGLAQSTANLNQAVKTAQTIGQVVAIATAGVTLATAIASGNLGSIVSALAGAEKAVAAVLPKPAVVAMPAPAANAATAPVQGNISALAASADPTASKGGG